MQGIKGGNNARRSKTAEQEGHEGDDFEDFCHFYNEQGRLDGRPLVSVVCSKRPSALVCLNYQQRRVTDRGNTRSGRTEDGGFESAVAACSHDDEI